MIKKNACHNPRTKIIQLLCCMTVHPIASHTLCPHWLDVRCGISHRPHSQVKKRAVEITLHGDQPVPQSHIKLMKRERSQNIDGELRELRVQLRPRPRIADADCVLPTGQHKYCSKRKVTRKAEELTDRRQEGISQAPFTGAINY
jgi:hypothetical protein